MKNWSFGKLMGVFAGSFVAIIVLAVVVMKMSASPVGKKVAVPNASFQQQQQQKSQVDVMSLQLDASKKQAQAALEAQKNSQTQLNIVRQEMQRNNQIMMSQFSQMNSKMDDMKQRMDFMEASRGRVEIIKPPRKDPQPSATTAMAKTGKHVPESSGYKVQATVGNRAWIKSGDREDSVAPGDKLPPVQKELRVKAIDNDSGIVITGPAR